MLDTCVYLCRYNYIYTEHQLCYLTQCCSDILCLGLFLLFLLLFSSRLGSFLLSLLFLLLYSSPFLALFVSFSLFLSFLFVCSPAWLWSDRPASSVYPSAGITGVCHHVWPALTFWSLRQTNAFSVALTGTHGSPPASVFQMLELQMCVTMVGF